MDWFRQAAEKGNVEAQQAYGVLLAQDCVKEGCFEAKNWLERAARQGHVGAQSDLATFLGLVRKHAARDRPGFRMLWAHVAKLGGADDVDVHISMLSHRLKSWERLCVKWQAKRLSKQLAEPRIGDGPVRLYPHFRVKQE